MAGEHEHDQSVESVGASADGGPLLTIAQAARLAGVSRWTVRRWISTGLLPTAGEPGAARLVRATDVEAVGLAGPVRGVVAAWRRDRWGAGTRLRTLREAAGFSQLELAAASGVVHEAISNLELGKHAPRGASVARLARALGVAPLQFVAGELPGGVLTTAEAAARLGVPEGRVRAWIKGGALPAGKVSGRWRIPAAAVAALAASGRLRGRIRRLRP